MATKKKAAPKTAAPKKKVARPKVHPLYAKVREAIEFLRGRCVACNHLEDQEHVPACMMLDVLEMPTVRAGQKVPTKDRLNVARMLARAEYGKNGEEPCPLCERRASEGHAKGCAFNAFRHSVTSGK